MDHDVSLNCVCRDPVSIPAPMRTTQLLHVPIGAQVVIIGGRHGLRVVQLATYKGRACPPKLSVHPGVAESVERPSEAPTLINSQALPRQATVSLMHEQMDIL